MRRNLMILILLTGLTCLCTYAYRVQSEQLAVADRLIRLHIVANSDSESDQSDKLAVRDAVLPVISKLTEACESKQEAAVALQNGMQTIQNTAEETLRSVGNAQTVTVSLGQELFPRRDYATFSLPAGAYDALRITLGNGDGHNWWCVAFPALCLPATSEDFAAAASTAGFSGQQTELLTGDDLNVELKFRFLDWITALCG